MECNLDLVRNAYSCAGTALAFDELLVELMKSAAVKLVLPVVRYSPRKVTAVVNQAGLA